MSSTASLSLLAASNWPYRPAYAVSSSSEKEFSENGEVLPSANPEEELKTEDDVLADLIQEIIDTMFDNVNFENVLSAVENGTPIPEKEVIAMKTNPICEFCTGPCGFEYKASVLAMEALRRKRSSEIGNSSDEQPGDKDDQADALPDEYFKLLNPYALDFFKCMKESLEKEKENSQDPNGLPEKAHL